MMITHSLFNQKIRLIESELIVNIYPIFTKSEMNFAIITVIVLVSEDILTTFALYGIFNTNAQDN